MLVKNSKDVHDAVSTANISISGGFLHSACYLHVSAVNECFAFSPVFAAYGYWHCVLRWYYDSAKDACAPFCYGGCEGNDNRFDTEQECISHCLVYHHTCT
uniref:BPTI/Kunitz inhibitor domain-containing protein n=1 Tax=Electrophorus electricus TaxID=8005 RepID=A0AAY5ER33_ELEEL